MKFVLASGNNHKADEIRAFLPGQFELVLQSDLGVSPADETGSTFIENALIKARHAANITGLPAIADDSGICVTSLQGQPGIYSARYAGLHASDPDNVVKLLSSLGDETNRQAFFHCSLVCLANADDPSPLIAQGDWYGEITKSPSGSAGFGYDPVFYLRGYRRTAAELTLAEKNEISHRGIALKKLKELLVAKYTA